MATVGAMITGETVQDFIAFIGHDGSGTGKLLEGKPFREDAGYTWQELALYLLAHGWSLGLFAFTHGIKNYKVDFPIRADVSSACTIIFCVKSKICEESEHVILWNGKQVLDPAPDADDSWTLDDYEILSIIPLVEWKWHDPRKAVENFLERIRGAE